MTHQKEQDDTTILSVQVPVKELDRVKRVAASECRTVSGHVRFLLRRDLEEREKTWSQ